ncbi:hypothetical protein BH23PSE1_BH23PSE1_14040 [soil metagenome]
MAPVRDASPADLLEAWLARQLGAAEREWLDGAIGGAGESDRGLFMAVSFVQRKLGKADLALTPEDRAAAETARPGWDPSDWSVDQAARVLLLLRAGGTGDAFAAQLRTLFSTADVAETIAFLRGLPLYPDPERHVMRAREGARSNMRPVFEAVAHRSPYPMERFDENAWNHMVLKALFVGAALHPIEGLEARANPELARILRDYAHERWAAGRPVTPEFWRGVGRFVDAGALADLERVLSSGAALEREGAALALADCPRPEAKALLGAVPDLEAAIGRGDLTWPGLGRTL